MHAGALHSVTQEPPFVERRSSRRRPFAQIGSRWTKGLAPVLLTAIPPPFTREGWTFELKYDGWRCLAEIRDGQARLQSRRGFDLSRRWPTLVTGRSSIPGHHILDGEICLLGLSFHPARRLQAASTVPHCSGAVRGLSVRPRSIFIVRAIDEILVEFARSSTTSPAAPMVPAALGRHLIEGVQRRLDKLRRAETLDPN